MKPIFVQIAARQCYIKQRLITTKLNLFENVIAEILRIRDINGSNKFLLPVYNGKFEERNERIAEVRGFSSSNKMTEQGIKSECTLRNVSSLRSPDAAAAAAFASDGGGKRGADTLRLHLPF